MNYPVKTNFLSVNMFLRIVTISLKHRLAPFSLKLQINASHEYLNFIKRHSASSIIFVETDKLKRVRHTNKQCKL